jgi:two-component system, NarL family, sensor kinase
MKATVVAVQPSTAPSMVMPAMAVRRKQSITKECSTHMLQSHDEEHRLMARALHDNTSQNLAALLMSITVLQSNNSLDDHAKLALERCVSLVEQSSTEIRTICYQLYPPALDELGLGAALYCVARKFEREAGVVTKVDVAEDLGRFPQYVEVAVFRVVEEALLQMQSRAASISARRDCDELTVSVSELNAGGCRTGGPAELAPMASSRVQQIGGTLEVSSTRRGMRIVLRVPLRKEQVDATYVA